MFIQYGWQPTLFLMSLVPIKSNIIPLAVIFEAGLKPLCNRLGIAYAAKRSRHEVCIKSICTQDFKYLNLIYDPSLIELLKQNPTFSERYL